MTLKEILAEHPEWADLPVAVYRVDGEHELVGESATVYEYEDEETKEKFVIFAGN